MTFLANLFHLRFLNALGVSRTHLIGIVGYGTAIADMLGLVPGGVAVPIYFAALFAQVSALRDSDRLRG